MISFACKEISLQEIITCSFELNKTDYKVFDFLMRNEGAFLINYIADKLELERSGVQKAIQRLVDKSLVERKQINLQKGGYKFYYSIKDKEEIKRRVEEIIDGWHHKVKEEIKKWNQQKYL